MASTFSSIGNALQPLLGCGKYDVFINHGIDVKSSLASIIYNTLGLIGIRAFLDREELEEWKMALPASGMSGHEVNKRQNDLGLLLKKIVNNVTEMKNMHVATHPAGLDEAMERRKNVKVVGIVGMGRCGKITILKEYFNGKKFSYTESSFLCDVREAAAKNRLHALPKKKLHLLHFKEAIHHTSEGKRPLEHRVLYAHCIGCCRAHRTNRSPVAVEGQFATK